MTIEQIREFCNEVAAKHNFKINFPIEVNGRLTATLGRVTTINGVIVSMEMSRRHLETATDEAIIETVLHELAHAFAIMETGENHGHDAVFKAMCHRIGTGNDKAYHNNLKLKKPKEEIYKYGIYCVKCGKAIGYRSRACKLTKYPQAYLSTCCSASLNVIQNF